jgi:hypothetical protein
MLSLGQVHTHGDVPTFGNSAGILQLVMSSACHYNRKKNKSFDFLERIANEEDFFSCVITGDESWIFNTVLRTRGKVMRGTL